MRTPNDDKVPCAARMRALFGGDIKTMHTYAINGRVRQIQGRRMLLRFLSQGKHHIMRSGNLLE
jgi:hypothetical protein